MTVQILDPAIWHPVPIAPMPLLEDMRNAVLLRSTTRMPKWKFRVEPDVVMQIQPRPDTRTKANRQGLPWFDCQAVIRDDVTGDMLKDPPPESWKMNFRVSITDPWQLKVCRYGCGTGCTSDAALIVRDRLVAVIPVAFKRLHPEMMLKPCCLACGKMLTDPVSMARWIGPECYGTSSAVIPYTFQLADPGR
jgi:Family of unknown function (DUF6011)